MDKGFERLRKARGPNKDCYGLPGSRAIIAAFCRNSRTRARIHCLGARSTGTSTASSRGVLTTTFCSPFSWSATGGFSLDATVNLLLRLKQ